VWFHIITKGSGYENGEVTPTMLQATLDVLNADYAGQFVFQNAGSDITNNPTWFVASPRSTNPTIAFQYTEMKKALHKGGPETLNLYFNMPEALLGIATFPNQYNTNPGEDGVVVHYGTVPGGSYAKYNLGKTATHEIGHWLGLYHTFEGGCADNVDLGDGVSDTPAEGLAAYGCPIGRDSCVGDAFPGLDPVTNFMDYTDDACMTGFTA
ncbi:hypothetical protein BDR26DRAFT_785216, partial [Obelidium mucronatum]